MATKEKKKELAEQAGYRAFNVERKDGTIVRVSTRNPTQEELEGADLNQSSAFNQALMHGLPTRAFLKRKLKRNGVWDTLAEEELAQGRYDIEQLMEVVRANKGKFATPEEEAEFDKKRSDLFDKIRDIAEDFQSLLIHTADTKADNAYANYLVACVTEYADGDKAGERVFESVTAFENDTDVQFGSRVRYEFNLLQNGLPSEYIEAELLADATRLAAQNTNNTTTEGDSNTPVTEATSDDAGVVENDDLIITDQATVGNGQFEDKVVA